MPAASCLAVVQLVGLEGLQARVPAALARGLELSTALTHRLAGEHGGAVRRSSVRGISVCFDHAVDATTFTMRLHEEMLEQPWSPTLLVHPNAAEERDDDGTLLYRGLRLRAAVHRGPVFPDAQRLMGPAVYHAARLLEAAHPGQTLVSQEAWRFLSGPMPAGTVIRDLGTQGLPGVQGRTRIFQVLPAGADRRSFGAITTDEASAPITRLPRIIGREGDLRALHELLGLGGRLVTVVGPEGVGRGRLCAQLAKHAPATLQAQRVVQVKLRGPGTLEALRATADSLEVPTSHARSLADGLGAGRSGRTARRRGWPEAGAVAVPPGPGVWEAAARCGAPGAAGASGTATAPSRSTTSTPSAESGRSSRPLRTAAAAPSSAVAARRVCSTSAATASLILRPCRSATARAASTALASMVRRSRERLRSVAASRAAWARRMASPSSASSPSGSGWCQASMLTAQALTEGLGRERTAATRERSSGVDSVAASNSLAAALRAATKPSNGMA